MDKRIYSQMNRNRRPRKPLAIVLIVLAIVLALVGTFLLLKFTGVWDSWFEEKTPTRIVAVTDENGNILYDENGNILTEEVPILPEKEPQDSDTKIVAVTDENGNPLYDENGNLMTEAVPVDSTPASNEDSTDTSEPANTEPVPQPSQGHQFITMDSEDLYTGNLILVNGNYDFKPQAEPKCIVFYGNKNTSYKLAYSHISVAEVAFHAFDSMMAAMEGETGLNDIKVNSGYRSIEDQQATFDAKLEQYGQEDVHLYVATPGYSEHHTGLAVDFNIYTDEGASYYLNEKEEYFNWITENAWRFGFIHRYAEDKISITGIAYEPWHYRYVGAPHAYYIQKNGLCLEEYIDLLRNYTFEGEHLILTLGESEEGTATATYEAWFVPSSGEETTTIEIPEGREYTISGNNVDGFIVTVIQ